jgi:hypothetical protein
VGDDYLWDSSGRPDPEVERLERLLRPLGHDGRPLRLEPARRGFAGLLPLAAAASVALALSALVREPRAAAPGWAVARLDAGAPTPSRLAEGQWIETDAGSRLWIQVGAIGEVRLEPRTRVRLVDSGRASPRLTLARGVLHALIWAPPGDFVVETPSATAVDLGCAYTLEVDESGAGLLTVDSGWVGFVHRGRESFVPAGARCPTRPAAGPGTPHFQDASQAFRDALATLDFDLGLSARDAALGVVLAEARPRDAFSLWHLLSRLPGDARERLYERLAALAPPPAGVTREAVLRGERSSLDAWWNALGLEDVSWWRLWERPWEAAE